MNKNQKVDVIVVIDSYPWLANGTHPREKSEAFKHEAVKREASALMGLVKSHGQKQESFILFHEADKEREGIYASFGQNMRGMNGNRPTELPQVAHEMAEEVRKLKPRKVIVVGNEPAFDEVCRAAAQVNAEVCVWLPGAQEAVPALAKYAQWHLEELMPQPAAAEGSMTASAVWIDAENALIGMRKLGLAISAEEYIEVLRHITQQLGLKVNRAQAWADWSSLRRQFGCDDQVGFERCEVKTFYQINIPGKSSSDMAMMGNIQETLGRDADTQTYVLNTGDADFVPVVETIHAHGKRVVVIAWRSCLSAALRKAADEVICLEDTLSSRQRDAAEKSSGHDKEQATGQTAKDAPSAYSLAGLLKIAHLLRVNHWFFVYTAHLPQWIQADWVRQAVAQGWLEYSTPHRTDTVTLNGQHPLVKEVMAVEKWLMGTLYFCYHKPDPFAYVDASLLFRKLQAEEQLADCPWTRDLTAFLEVLNAAAAAGLLEKQSIAHPTVAGRKVISWNLGEG